VKSPPNNPRAIAAYRCALYGLIPLAGLVLGPVAVALGVLGLRHPAVDAKDRTHGFASAAVILGVLELLTNGIGLTLIGIGLASLNS
jgi:hypothetical protein